MVAKTKEPSSKKLGIQLELESRLISDIVTKATGLSDAECRKKLRAALRIGQPERYKFWLDYYNLKGQFNENCTEDGWVFLTDCTDVQLDACPTMIALIKGEDIGN
jgi:hypothetical protein